MSLFRIFVLSLAISHGFVSAPTAEAQGNFDQSWKNLSPDTRKEKREQFFSDLPETQQKRLRENQRKFHSLPADQKRSLCERFLSQNGYAPPACQSLLGN